MFNLGRQVKKVKLFFLSKIKIKFYKIYIFLISIGGIYKFITTNKKKPDIKKFSKNLDKINDYEYKFRSQNNEDGIIDKILSKITNNQINSIEIGLDYYENNSLNLLKRNGKYLLIEGNAEKCIILKVIVNLFYKKKNIKIINTLVNKDNINKLIKDSFLDEEIDFLSIDVDSIDYFLFENLNVFPKLICIEYNHWLGKDRSITIPYNPNFFWDQSDCYFGSSLLALNKLANKKDYYLVAIDSSGTNAFFVHGKLKDKFTILDPIKSFKKPEKYSDEDSKAVWNIIKDKAFISI